MGFRYTKATREIIQFVQEYGFITISICSILFYKDNKQRYNQARVKLNKLVEEKELRVYQDVTGENIYQIKLKPIGDHRKYMIRLYAYLKEYVEVEYFKLEEVWTECNRRSDAHIIIKTEDKRIGLLCEFEKFHLTNASKYNELYESREVNKWYIDRYNKDYFPTVLLITPTGTTNCIDKENRWQTLSIDYKFTNLKDVL